MHMKCIMEYGVHSPIFVTEYTIDRTYRKKIGIVGFGNTGQATAQIAEALGMEVWVYTSKPKKSLPKKYQKVTLNELFSACDVVSLHCPLTAENKEMVNSFRLSLMKQGAILINTSRGGLIDEKALEQALLSGKLLGADWMCSLRNLCLMVIRFLN